jgi:hypothetical protein
MPGLAAGRLEGADTTACGARSVGACVLGVEEAQDARIKHPPSPAQVMRWPMMDQYKYYPSRARGH